MNVNELLDTIEDLLEESTGMPLSGGKRIVDVEQIRDYLDDIRANLPVELRQAQSIVGDRAQLIESANAQAQAIVKKAEERARILVSEAEIVRAAQQRASEIVSAAQTEARTVRRALDDAGNVRHHEAHALVDIHDAEVGVERGEVVVGDLRPRLGNDREQRRFADVGEADEAHVREQLEL